MVRKEHFREIIADAVELRDNYNDLEQLIEHADDLSVAIADSEKVFREHEEFIALLEAHYLSIEYVLSQSGRIEDPDGQTVQELPAPVPTYIDDRVATSPKRPNRDISNPDRST